MKQVAARMRLVRLAMALALFALAFALVACKGESKTAEPPADEPPAAEQPEQKAEEPPTYSKWVVYINDHDTRMKGGMTYKVTLNLNATNPSSTKAGTYTGEAVASTETSGKVGKGAQLNASAIANSSKLEFTLVEDDTVTEEDPLAPLTEEGKTYSGTGTISMDAAGSGTVGPAGGSFEKSSSEQITVKATGSKLTLSVILNGQKFTFDGTISGK